MNGSSKRKGAIVPNPTTIQIVLCLCVVGIATSLYMVKDHYSAAKSVCDIDDTISCSKINKSSFSKLFHVPIAIFGVTWFIGLASLTFNLWENDKDAYVWAFAHFIYSIFGMLFVVYLLVAEFILRAICPFCTVVHIIICINMYSSYKLYQEQRKIQPTIGQLLSTLLVWLIVIGVIHLLPLIYFNLPIEPPPPSHNPSQLDKSVVDAFAKCLDSSGTCVCRTHGTHINHVMITFMSLSCVLH
jgi:uncharacterized membrane protein